MYGSGKIKKAAKKVLGKTKIKKRKGIRAIVGSVKKTPTKKIVYHDRFLDTGMKEKPTTRKVVTKMGKGVKKVQKYYADGTLKKEKIRGINKLARKLRRARRKALNKKS